MSLGPGPLTAMAVVAVLLAARGWHGGVHWWAAQRALARTGGAAPPRSGPLPVQRALTATGIDLDAAVALQLWAASVVVAMAASFVLGGGPVLVAAAVAGPPVAVVALRGRADRLRIRHLPVVLDSVAAGLRGGGSLRSAIADTAAVTDRGVLRAELARIAGHAEAGRPLAETLGDWARAAADPPTRLAAAALVVAAEIGGPGADALEAAATSLRDRAAAEDEVGALSVQARLSAALLTAAPLVFAVLLANLDPTSAAFLFRTPAGWACVALGLSLDALGALWMSRLVGGAR